MDAKRAADNAMWSVDAGCGITLLEAPTPENSLPGRYQYELPAETAGQMVVELKRKMKELDGVLQCSIVSVRTLARGIRLNVFLLGYDNVDAAGMSLPGIGEGEWEDAVGEVLGIIRSRLPDIIPYIEDWSTESKFQARWAGYIKYKEL